MNKIIFILAVLFSTASFASAPFGYEVAKHHGKITPAKITSKEISYDDFRSLALETWQELDYRDDEIGDDWNENAKKFGDCEDFALLLRKKLIKNGYGGRFFSLATGYVGRVNPVNHAVLIVTTSDRGRLVFDNAGIYQISEFKVDKIEYMGVWR